MRNTQLFSMALLVMCSAACSSSSSSDGSGSVSCRQKADSDTGNDCAAHSGKPRKLDCSLVSETEQAIAAGCVREKEGDTDVCCPTTVTGKTEQKLSCTEPADTLTDSSCAGTPLRVAMSQSTTTASQADTTSNFHTEAVLLFSNLNNTF